ncbi:DNA mismatch repair PMS1 [Lecanosticta acicola]|uniref:DNA mismatch repair protein PMS1 n=1 Tax=Lecanosticta acicola TaxID=111012 RepID=A0AAI8Z7M2_9PEZI|nr:DNA mismatch repair PMS1 [Lecanosticta acicola]
MATIKPIENGSVHQITSGQVITDLRSVVKELLENSLDAGATSIEVRFVNQGLDAIEVKDNGRGISPEDYDSVAVKHATSKLSTYDDLSNLDTFGFRGEALSSLCALAKLSVLTARAEDDVGKKLEFDMSGRLKSTSPSAAQKGTTVYVEDIFYNLPVRRKELEKNIKRDFSKLLEHMNAYACISVGVRIAVSNQMPKGKKVPVFSTKSNTTTKENIMNVFGAKTLLSLLPLDLHLEMAPSLGPSTQSARNWSTQATNRSLKVHVQGHISKPIIGEGRSAPDRQMFFVNSRPCQLPQVKKAITEVYNQFNISQTPFIFANLLMDTNAYDVNVSPDKRTILLHDQQALLESLKANLTELFERTDQTVPHSTLSNRKLPTYQPLSISRRPTAEASLEATAEHSESNSEGDDAAEHRTYSLGSPSNLIHGSGRDATCRSEKQFSKTQERRNAAAEARMVADSSSVVEAAANDDRPSSVVHCVTAEDSRPPGVQNETIGAVKSYDAALQPAENTSNGIAHIPSADSHRPVDRTDAVTNPAPLSTPYDDLFSQRPPIQPPVPSFAPGSTRASPGPIQNAFDKMRPKRTPQQVAEITVGDKTTTTVIGSSLPPWKKRRVYKPENSQAIAAFGASPMLARGLRRNFAAPGSQLELQNREIQEDSDDEVEGSSRMECLGDQKDDEDSDNDDDIMRDAPDGAEDDVLETDEREQEPYLLGAKSYSDLRDGLDSTHGRHCPIEPSSGILDDASPAPVNDDEWDEDYMDEEEKKRREDERVAALIQQAEENAARPTEQNVKRAEQVFKHGLSRKRATTKLVGYLNDITTEKIEKGLSRLQQVTSGLEPMVDADGSLVKQQLDDEEAESRLSLTVTKADFGQMKIVGQFNLGFILAVRPGTTPSEDDLFIIDQHAADEKYNFECLQRTTQLQSQRLVRPKELELSAVQEEIVLSHPDALKANGFEIESTSSSTMDLDGAEDSHRSLRLLTLPMSKEKTFDLSDLEELIHLLSEHPSGSSSIPRPKKVQKILAMRACRSSIMVGKTLTVKQMERVVQHMGEMDKPWNCPHGRPTMRHLANLSEWTPWCEADSPTDWAAWLTRRK